MIQLIYFSLNVEAEIQILLVSNLLRYMHLDWNVVKIYRSLTLNFKILFNLLSTRIVPIQCTPTKLLYRLSSTLVTFRYTYAWQTEAKNLVDRTI